MACVEVVLTILTYYHVPAWKREILPDLVCKSAIRYKIDPHIIMAVIKAETEFHHFRKHNRTHDYGIMQVHCPNKRYAPWCRDIRKVQSLAGNIDIGVYLLSRKKKKCREFRHRGHHWVKHYNWRSKTWTKRVLKNLRKMKKISSSYKST